MLDIIFQILNYVSPFIAGYAIWLHNKAWKHETRMAVIETRLSVIETKQEDCSGLGLAVAKLETKLDSVAQDIRDIKDDYRQDRNK
jgi:hypothetical protein